MIDFKYLYLGLCGMARAHSANAMTGHLGAAVTAGYFIGEDQSELNDRVTKGIETDLDEIIRGEESIWYNAQKTGIAVPSLFEAFPDKPVVGEPVVGEPVIDEQKQQAKIATIAKALSVNIDKLRQSGHNVIFSSIAIRALNDHAEYATDEIIGGIEKLIAQFNDQGSGRGYFGKERGWLGGFEVELGPESDFPAYQNQQAMVDRVIDELIESGAKRRQGFGGLFHIINHAAALTELSRFGYEKLAKRGLEAHHQHVRLWRSLPDVEDELGPLKSAKHDPLTPGYWEETDSKQWSAHLTHRVKTIYGFHTLLRFVESAEKRKQAEEKFLYLMG